MESLDSEQLVIGYANSRQSPIDAGMVLMGFIFFYFIYIFFPFEFGVGKFDRCGGCGVRVCVSVIFFWGGRERRDEINIKFNENENNKTTRTSQDQDRRRIWVWR